MRKVKYKVVSEDNKSAFLSLCNGIKKYRLNYKKDTIVEAPKGTLGIMVFERKYQAEKFIRRQTDCPACFNIKRVLSIGKGKKPYSICRISILDSDYDLDQFYRKNIIDPFYRISKVSPPDGTICYPAVKVLD